MVFLVSNKNKSLLVVKVVVQIGPNLVTSGEQQWNCLLLTADSPTAEPWFHVTLSISAVLSGAIIAVTSKIFWQGSGRLALKLSTKILKNEIKYIWSDFNIRVRDRIRMVKRVAEMMSL